MADFSVDGDPRQPSPSGPFKLDEGFAEDSQQNGDQIQNTFIAWLNTQSEKAKAEIAYEILRTLRSTDIAAVVDRLNPLLHMDPIEKLPPEIISQIFSYLDASTLLTASLSSATWRERILDPRLWQELYRSEGWVVDRNAVRAFEEAHSDLVRSEFKKIRAEPRDGFAHNGQPLFKRRATSDWLQSAPRRVSASAEVAQWREQHGTIEADQDAIVPDGGDSVMTDVLAQSPQRPNKRQSQDDRDEMDLGQDSASQPASVTDLLLLDGSGQAKLNWPYVYKQRHKLEQNWLKGRYAPFQLPHPNFPQEAHVECVYTIQFFGKWLVSGSRDKTVRVWDLDTRRLRGKPLLGHSQSVLCLQFDPTEEEDIIISGSSDSSIVVWKFSTGQKLHTINSAHEESVLNLRFDHRYLVTCSKDKKIKVWNRKQLLPTDPDYPKARYNESCKTPSHIVDLTDIDISIVEARLANGTYRALRPFSHLMTFEGHNAAVNAIQIHENLIVSASGDRTIRVWDINTGTGLRVIAGHMKGIACVQYDGKRVVSGSSDNSVRVYDPTTGTEVAVLMGHSNLVRTVQADFGDIIGSEEEDRAAARAAEQRYQEDINTQKIVEDRAYSRRLRNGDFGSSRVTMGSNLPPGGGGSKWARIVSGSYDESIIIWKKDSDGNWVVGQTLKQNDTTQNNNIEVDTDQDMNGRRQHRVRRNPLTIQRLNQNTNTTPAQDSSSNQSAISNTVTLGSGNVISASQIVQATMNTSMASLQASVQNIMGVRRGLAGVTGPDVQNAMNRINASAQAAVNEAITNAIANGRATFNASITATAGSNRADQQTQQDSAPSSRQATPQVPVQQPQPVPMPPQQQAQAASQQQQQQQQQHQQQQQQQQQQQHHQNQTPSVSRVFKLQFDARRIVCCSQDSRIIGWDFANADPEIEECSRFFLGP